MKSLKDILKEGILSDIDINVAKMDNAAELAKILSWLEPYKKYFKGLQIEADNSIFCTEFNIRENHDFTGFPDYIKFSEKHTKKTVIRTGYTCNVLS